MPTRCGLPAADLPSRVRNAHTEILVLTTARAMFRALPAVMAFLAITAVFASLQVMYVSSVGTYADERINGSRTVQVARVYRAFRPFGAETVAALALGSTTEELRSIRASAEAAIATATVRIGGIALPRPSSGADVAAQALRFLLIGSAWTGTMWACHKLCPRSGHPPLKGCRWDKLIHRAALTAASGVFIASSAASSAIAWCYSLSTAWPGASEPWRFQPSALWTVAIAGSSLVLTAVPLLGSAAVAHAVAVSTRSRSCRVCDYPREDRPSEASCPECGTPYSTRLARVAFLRASSAARSPTGRVGVFIFVLGAAVIGVVIYGRHRVLPSAAELEQWVDANSRIVRTVAAFRGGAGDASYFLPRGAHAVKVSWSRPGGGRQITIVMTEASAVAPADRSTGRVCLAWCETVTEKNGRVPAVTARIDCQRYRNHGMSVAWSIDVGDGIWCRRYKLSGDDACAELYAWPPPIEMEPISMGDPLWPVSQALMRQSQDQLNRGNGDID